MKGFDGSLYETHQVFYPSKDGTKIPMFIVHKKVENIALTFYTIKYGVLKHFGRSLLYCYNYVNG